MTVSVQHCPLCLRRRVGSEGWVDTVQRTMDMLYALGCHVHGEAAALVAVGELDLVDTIECTVFPHVVPLVARCLRASGMDVMQHHRPGSGSRGSGRKGNVIPNGTSALGGVSCEIVANGSRSLRLDIVPFARDAIGQLESGCMDYMRISSSAEMLYSRAPSPATQTIPTIHSLLQRLVERRFCLSAIPANPVRAIQKSARLVSSGWTMDDRIHGRRVWVVARWGEMTTRPHRVRGDAACLGTHAECAICLTAFAKSDLVINLPCNHNFHAVQCHSTNSNNGLCTWATLRGNAYEDAEAGAEAEAEAEEAAVTCPCCRGAINAQPQATRMNT
jgi:hypothetical protein